MRYLSVFLVLSLALHGCSDDGGEGQELMPLQVDAGCDSAISVCTAEADGIAMQLYLPDEVRTLQRFPLRIELDTSRSVQRIEVSLEMVGMDMGDNRYSLHPGADEKEWQASVMLPVCSQGRSDWVARFTVETSSGSYAASFPFTAQ